jgi:hypothetical protein
VNRVMILRSLPFKPLTQECDGTGLNNAPTKAGVVSDRSRSTQGGLPLVLLLCFVIATALGLYALSFLRTVLVSERGRELAMNAAAVADALDRVMFERFGDIQLFANDGILRDGTRPEKTARLLSYKQLYQYYSWLGVADERGQLIAATDALPAQGTQGLSPESFELVRRTGTVSLRRYAALSNIAEKDGHRIHGTYLWFKRRVSRGGSHPGAV